MNSTIPTKSIPKLPTVSQLFLVIITILLVVKKLLYFVWSPPWHFCILLLANLLAFYLTYLLAFYLAYLLAYYLLKSSGILSGKHSGTLSGISSGILSDILSGILSGIPSGILPGISSNILSGISSGTLSGISSNILSGISSGTLSGISSGILSGRWGPAVHTELGRSQVEVQRCTLRWEGPRLRSSGAHWAGKVPRLRRSSSAHWAGKVPGWGGPAVCTNLGRSQVEVQQCALSSEVGEELGKELARRKWRWKLMQTWSRRNWRRRRRRRRATALRKSNNPHLAGGEKTPKNTLTTLTLKAAHPKRKELSSHNWLERRLSHNVQTIDHPWKSPGWSDLLLWLSSKIIWQLSRKIQKNHLSISTN